MLSLKNIVEDIIERAPPFYRTLKQIEDNKNIKYILVTEGDAYVGTKSYDKGRIHISGCKDLKKEIQHQGYPRGLQSKNIQQAKQEALKLMDDDLKEQLSGLSAEEQEKYKHLYKINPDNLRIYPCIRA